MEHGMEEFEMEHMKKAIFLAEQCRPIADRIPKVGAVIAVGETVIGQGHRGTGNPNDDEHAESHAIRKVADRSQLPKATVFTTLEPCTPEVRSDPLKCCTELIRQGEVKKVFIGILDPNQGVRGKGLWELQDRGVEVELFPPNLAKQIRVLNDKFIREQRSLGIRITDPEPGQIIRTFDKAGVWTVKGKFLNPPGADVFAFVVEPKGHWFPQPHALRLIGETNEWEVKIHFGRYGPHSIYIIKASELGVYLVNYYRKVFRTNQERKDQLRGNLKFENKEEVEFLRTLRQDHQGIEMGRLPKGLEIQAMVEVIVETPPVKML
jgi:diaminohydroxyphosphoribosylaminopyrimidine deaminase / 5-amino-6-(5-phosphoribosylamino)uracil reductase